MARPTIRTHNISLDELYSYAYHILTCMEQNVDIFPDPSPNLATFSDMIVELSDRMNDAAHGDKRAILLRNQQAEVLKNAIRKLSYYVGMIAEGDESIILASGFVPSKPSKPIGEAPKAKIIHVRNLDVGSCSVKIRVKRWPPATAYRFEYRKAGGDADWQFVLSSKASCLIKNLEQFQEYEFRVAYMATDPNLIYSSVVLCVVV